MLTRLRHCLVLCATLLSAACAASDAPERKPAAATPGVAGIDIPSELRKSVATLEPLLPLRVHETGELIGIRTYDLVLELTFRYMGKNAPVTQEQDELGANAAKATVDAMGCGNPSIAVWLAQDVIVRYRFLDQDDRLIFAHDLKNENCSTPS